MPGWLHNFKHHVVLNVLDEVKHPLPQSEGTGKPERADGFSADDKEPVRMQCLGATRLQCMLLNGGSHAGKNTAGCHGSACGAPLANRERLADTVRLRVRQQERAHTQRAHADGPKPHKSVQMAEGQSQWLLRSAMALHRNAEWIMEL